MILSLFPRALLTKFLLVFILYRQLQKKLAKSNCAFTSAVIRVLALTEAPAVNCAKTLNTSSTAHGPWDISEEQPIASVYSATFLVCFHFFSVVQENISHHQTYVVLVIVWQEWAHFDFATLKNQDFGKPKC